MEKERLFREMYVQHKSSQGSDGNVRQRRPASGDKATVGSTSAKPPKLGIENMPSPAVTL